MGLYLLFGHGLQRKSLAQATGSLRKIDLREQGGLELAVSRWRRSLCRIDPSGGVKQNPAKIAKHRNDHVS
jgi:hypothetical protein